jgi:hypothetical protein
VLGAQELRNFFEGFVINQQGAEERLFHFLVLRHRAEFRLGGRTVLSDVGKFQGVSCHDGLK